MDPYDAEMFPNTVTVRKMTPSTGVQGGANPSAGTSATYAASVQPRGARTGERTGAPAAAPLAIIDYDVFISPAAGDTLIPSLVYGDEVDFGSVTLTVRGPTMDRGGQGILWWIQCEWVR